MRGHIANIKGQRFGRLVAREFVGIKDHKATWQCDCDCGKKVIVVGKSLRRGLSQSCGCLKNYLLVKRSTKHGMSHDRLYNIYLGMIKRCYNPKSRVYKHYGGRGITVCDEWLNSFIDFSKWAFKNGYQDDLEIDRIDHNGNYMPSNCRWADSFTQARNKRNNHLVTINGITKTLQEWSDEAEMDHKTLEHRIKSGWSSTDLLKPPNSFAGKRNINYRRMNNENSLA